MARDDDREELVDFGEGIAACVQAFLFWALLGTAIWCLLFALCWLFLG